MTNNTLLIRMLLFFALIGTGMSYGQKTASTTRIFGQPVHEHNIDPANGLIRCATSEYEQYLQQKDSKRMTEAEFEAWINPLLDAYRNGDSYRSETGGIITIPVVVHVIHSGQPVGVAPNITDAQVISQITVMNNDFRRMMGTPGYNTSVVGADTMIQFALAQVDPNGNPTNGINHVNLCQEAWSMDQTDAIVKPATQWNPALYLNMWSVDLGNGNEDILGYAQFPSGSGLPGAPFNGGPANTDGVVSDYATFGSINYNDGTFLINAPYNQGRTMTHEVGHALGLFHTWGNGSGCVVDDYCLDTPESASPNFGCATGIDSCPTNAGLDMVENYMDYSDDACMNIFTQNQKDRITVVMNNSIRRASLKTSTTDLAIPLFANDAEVKFEANCQPVGVSCSSGTVNHVQKFALYNRGTSNLTSATINYTINGGPSTPYIWTGNLPTHKYAIISVPVTATASGPATFTVVNANGVADQRASNNTANGTYTHIAPATPENYTMNNVVFRLQRDTYGAETQWNIKNSAGTILYSGGPYNNSAALPVLITQNWVLPSNGCYVFTITDSYGDGICCAEGNGFYDIKSTDGAVVITSGSDFGSAASDAFTINALGTDVFNQTAKINVYPNPTNGTLNIGVPSELGLPNSYTIFNALGQTIAQKAITTESDLSINTSPLSTGLYFINVAKDGQTTTLRFVKE